MDNNSTLIMIPVDKIYPHPDNPRKDLGDISELIESIKSRGIMQNLTVIPCGYNADDKYTVVIGHRRLAAAKRAGLKEVPCVVTHMTEKETLATMLLENMQRSDLTVYEQAQGFQMMIDLGERVSDIAEKTGFSESTVRRRVKLAKLDQEALKKVSGRQITFEDIDKLLTVEDEASRNKLLLDIGTSNFNSKLKNALADQKAKKAQKAMKDFALSKGLSEITWEERYGGNYEQVGYIYSAEEKEKVDDLISEKGATAFNISWGACYIYKVKSKKTRADERNARKKELDEAFKRAYELRREFMEKGPSRYDMVKALSYLMKFASEHCFNDFCPETACDILDINVGGNVEDSVIINALCEYAERDLSAHARSFAVFGYLSIGDSLNKNLYDWQTLKYDSDKDTDLQWIYGFLNILGYEISDEEQQLLDGSHPLYNKE